MKMVQRLSDRLRIHSDMRPPRVRQPPDRRPILIATKAMLFMGQDTNPGVTPTIPVKKAEGREFQEPESLSQP